MARRMSNAALFVNSPPFNTFETRFFEIIPLTLRRNTLPALNPFRRPDVLGVCVVVSTEGAPLLLLSLLVITDGVDGAASAKRLFTHKVRCSVVSVPKVMRVLPEEITNTCLPDDVSFNSEISSVL